MVQTAADVAGPADLALPDPAAASAVAMATVAETACISEKIGLSVLPSPYARFSTFALTAST